MKRISLEDIAALRRGAGYEELYTYIMKMLSDGIYKPVKASGTNGKKPALYLEYWILEEEKDYTELEEELKYRLVPRISNDYYLKHLAEYEQDQQYVRMLNEYLQGYEELLKEAESYNERSYEIWHREKFLTKGQGKKILKRCGIEVTDLNMYETSEPLSYYSHSRKTPQRLLILENKDTFYSMRRHLLSGRKLILGENIETLIYGAGKGILRSFLDFEICAEPYMTCLENTIYYFGDLDYEGIGIYENLAQSADGQYKIHPFVPAYEAMVEKAFGGQEETAVLTALPETKEGQNRKLTGHFYSYFKREAIGRMQRILKAGRYIPQEILNGGDF